jgi:hypothetical protein
MFNFKLLLVLAVKVLLTLPNSVCMPVAVTTAVQCPEQARLPMNTRLKHSASAKSLSLLLLLLLLLLVGGSVSACLS